MSDHQENNKHPLTHYERGVPVFDVQSEAKRKQTEDDAHDKQYKNDQITLNRRLVNATVALVVATIILGIVTGIQLLYVHRQWKLSSDGLSRMGDQAWAAKDAAFAAKDAAKTASVSLKSVQRAFIVFEGMDDIPLVERKISGEQQKFVFSAILENAGTTPSRGVFQYASGDANMLSAPSEKRFLGKPSQSFVIGPKSHTRVGRVIIPLSALPIDKSQTPQSVMTRDVRIIPVFFWGWTTYRDVFPDSAIHLTEWCQEVAGISGIPNPANTVGPPLAYRFTLDNCQTHNCTDDDCPDYKQIIAMQPE